jgi:hypothetical protein
MLLPVEKLLIRQRMYRLLPIVLLSRLTTYVDEITGEHQYGLQCNILHLSATGAKMGVQWDNTSPIYNFKKAYESFARHVYKIWYIHETSQAN